MNENMEKNKLKTQDIINEMNNLKKYAQLVGNNSTGDKIDSYVDKLTNDIIKAQSKVETIYDKNFQ